ncbi:non-hydrolyzing UDP-N-acetylglucosamine 2-epimerase [Sandaracinus amylolyticus]|uniref:non-hydrolyzing UDP-N-acetylglucosamine 2-epimerase n=1 Tax=Sandaracinus amylolyticus TaxID=927083 RepID=UPI001F22E2DB|nr:UDP-N-acetylglucosamine 2-epimerase (non-hydrolyzing) [Sandaracinus amylolyticus]
MRSFLHVVGARPNFVKAAPVLGALASAGATRQHVLHTGQHYDASLSSDVARDVGLPPPDVHLGIGAGSHAKQIAAVMIGVEEACARLEPDLVIVYGDVNSTLGGALGAAKAGIAVAHVEAGLRSRDRSMPEELNRTLVDHTSEWLFATDEIAAKNLRDEGLPASRVHVVGNVMADALLAALGERAREIGEHAIVTLHRPENVESREVLTALVSAIVELGPRAIFPAHPRTRARLREAGLDVVLERAGVTLREPLRYVEMARLLDRARVVITDSGGLQDESAVLGVPCVTVRTTTERPLTVACGSNHVAGTTIDAVRAAITRALAGPMRTGAAPPLWDGRAAQRIARVLIDS